MGFTSGQYDDDFKARVAAQPTRPEFPAKTPKAGDAPGGAAGF
jgi:hypothetical protein